MFKMSLTSTSLSESEEKSSRNDLIQTILHQGQILRNAMVQSILNHDPFNTEILNNGITDNLVTSRLRTQVTSKCSNLDNYFQDTEKRKLEAFLRGELMTPQDRVECLESLRSMSSEVLCKATNDVYCSKCTCTTCLKYDNNDLDCDLQRFKRIQPKKDANIQLKKISSKTLINNESNKYLQYVDCMQVIIHDLKLNDKGNKKLNTYISDHQKIPTWGSQTFFIEYELPFILSAATYSRKSNNNCIRICARRISSEAVYFKHTSMHNVKNLDKICLEGIKIKFHITCRTMRQKNITPVGYALFDFARFQSSPTFTCIEELAINFDDAVPIVLGNVQVTLQLGYGRLYFGNEFIACLQRSEEELQIFKPKDNGDRVFDKVLNQVAFKRKETIVQDNIPSNITEGKKISDKPVELRLNTQELQQFSTVHTRVVLFGFIYIPEAHYTKAVINSFITCRPFCQEENCSSDLVLNELKPIFNFSQLLPLIYDETLLQQFRDNFMVIEFWEKLDSENKILGLSKLSLNQFYLAYRNADITKYLLDNKLPVISVDGWVSITNPYTDESVGQVQVLLALGGEQQIQNLQLDRGFKKNSVQAVLQTPLEINENGPRRKTIGRTKIITNKNHIQPEVLEKTNFKNIEKSHTSLKGNIKKITKDQSVQFNSEMDREAPTEKEEKSDMKLDQILNHLIDMKKQQEDCPKGTSKKEADENKLKSTKVDDDIRKTDNRSISQFKPEDGNSMITGLRKECQIMPPLVRSTSDLLNSLHIALSVPPPCSHSKSSVQQTNYDFMSKKSPSSFKVQIAVNQALHLPIRKKCKAKRNKGKTIKMDENVKPSSYVTFETMPGLDLKMTPLVAKSVNPEWNYKCDVILPAELLLNNKKRLIFKIWRKSTNTNMVPNLQTDSIIGFAALDLTVLLSGLPNIKGWFNIVDLSSKCNGQIDIHILPLEDLSVFKVHKESYHNSVPPSFNPEENKNSHQEEVLNSGNHDVRHEDGEGELLGRALKRKFAELDEITQRLRLRLSNVTGDETDDGSDEFAEQFEKDINTLSIEDDFDMVNFEHEASNHTQITDLLKIECASETSSEHTNTHNALCFTSAEEDVEESLSILDKQLLIGKQRIDTLLGKLSLISSDTNNSRYISGCSGSNVEEGTTNIDTEAILKSLSRDSRPNINASTSYDRAVFRQIYEYPENDDGTEINLSSNNSVITNFEESRPAPDGEGTYSEDRGRPRK